MNRFFRPLLALTAILGVTSAGVHFLQADRTPFPREVLRRFGAKPTVPSPDRK